MKLEINYEFRDQCQPFFRATKEDKPKSKEDFQRLYAELESWRMKQEKKITEQVSIL